MDFLDYQDHLDIQECRESPEVMVPQEKTECQACQERMDSQDKREKQEPQVKEEPRVSVAPPVPREVEATRPRRVGTSWALWGPEERGAPQGHRASQDPLDILDNQETMRWSTTMTSEAS